MSKKEIVYLAGPYRAKHWWTILGNIYRAWRGAVKLWRAGYVVICPHANTFWMSEWPIALPATAFLGGDLLLVERSDHLVLLPGWEESAGTCGEMAHALAKKVPIWFSIEEFLNGRN